jgi:hypothetical protein
MRIGVVGAVLTLLVAEGGMLCYFAGERVARAPEDLQTMAGLQEKFEAARRSAAPGLSQIRRSAVTSNPPATSAQSISQGPVERWRIGFPFHLSPSVVEDCRHSPGFTCRGLEQFLDEMTYEWRDATWAAEMETRLEQWVTRGQRDRYRIRALECRSTRCAVEVASEFGYARVVLASDDVLDRALRWTGATAAAWEIDPSTGNVTVVTVATWQRRFAHADTR